MARFSCAVWRPIDANTGGVLADNRGLFLHHAVMNGSCFGLFDNPATQASAHFLVFKDGRIEQYVDTAVVAWHAGDAQANAQYCGVETEGCPTSPYAEAMPEAMVAALGRLYAEGARVHGWANATIEAVGGRGFGYHRMASSTACPCDVRLSRRAEILARAFGGSPAPVPPPTPAPPSSSSEAPPFPYPADHYLGRPDPDPKCHSGFYGGPDTENVRRWQETMRARGWPIDVDGCYGDQSYGICRQFQAEKGLGVDGLTGPATWAATWAEPVT